MVGLDPDLFKQRDGGRLRGCVELRAQQVHADLVMVQRRGPFATLHIAPHHETVGVLATGIARQQPPDMLQTAAVVTSAIGVIGQLRQQR